MRLSQPKIEEAMQLIRDKAANPDKELSNADIQLMYIFKNENPHGYEPYFIDGLTIYALNEDAAKEKAAKILKKKMVKCK